MKGQVFPKGRGDLTRVTVSFWTKDGQPVDIRGFLTGNVKLYREPDFDPETLPLLPVDVDPADPGNVTSLDLTAAGTVTDIQPGTYRAFVHLTFAGDPTPRRYPPKGWNILVVSQEPNE